MANTLDQYYRGITRRLRSSVDSINQLFEHQGLKGQGNEGALRELVAGFIPQRYGVGSGVVIDQAGAQSRQCDIVIYDKFEYPALLALSDVHLYPVDIVYATIEVKTTLTAASSKEALENIASVRRLKMIKDPLYIYFGSDGSQHIGRVTPPMGMIFAYNSKAKQCETLKQWFTPPDVDAAVLYPLLVACLDVGICRNYADAYLPAMGVKEPELEVYPASAEIISCEACPQKELERTLIEIDQSLVLLMFLLDMVKWLAWKWIRPDIDFTCYLPENRIKGCKL